MRVLIHVEKIGTVTVVWIHATIQRLMDLFGVPPSDQDIADRDVETHKWPSLELRQNYDTLEILAMNLYITRSLGTKYIQHLKRCWVALLHRKNMIIATSSETTCNRGCFNLSEWRNSAIDSTPVGADGVASWWCKHRRMEPACTTRAMIDQWTLHGYAGWRHWQMALHQRGVRWYSL